MSTASRKSGTDLMPGDKLFWHSDIISFVFKMFNKWKVFGSGHENIEIFLKELEIKHTRNIT
jgi:hypothetical protein